MKHSFIQTEKQQIYLHCLERRRQKRRLLKRLKNIEDKNEEIKIKTGIKSQIDLFNENSFSEEIKDIEDNVDYNKFFFKGGNKKDYYFQNFKTLEKLIKDIYNRDNKRGRKKTKLIC